ncbi:MAG: T9SS type A sorting domain-containing protein, partial [Bacteroidetes bacterium]|nr:T9SS type A sorting domain-containing protein [Bacteroidota bacterium]
ICGERNGVYLIKTSSNGTLLWSKTYGNLLGANGKTSAQQTNDGGYIITGTIPNSITGFDIYLIKTDSIGNSGCNETNPTTMVSSGGIQNTRGVQGAGGAVLRTIATQTFSGGIETTLCLMLGVNEIKEPQVVSIFPNPFSTQTTLRNDIYFNDASLTIYNLFGQIVKQMKNISGQTVTIIRENLTSDVYYIRIEDNKTIWVNKLVITD